MGRNLCPPGVVKRSLHEATDRLVMQVILHRPGCGRSSNLGICLALRKRVYDYGRDSLFHVPWIPFRVLCLGVPYREAEIRRVLG